MPHFNSRPSARGDDARSEGAQNWRYFNSRPSARGDGTGCGKLRQSTFQFTPLREGRRNLRGIATRDYYFNSRPSARGDATLNMSITGRLYFNSRPSARGDKCSGRNILLCNISIHAPPRGATSFGY